MSIEGDRSDRPSSSSDPVEVLYEIQHHAQGGPPTPSPGDRSQQAVWGLKRGSLSAVFSKGVQLLKKKWIGSKRIRAFNEEISLFISLNGEHLAVTSGNQITMLRKEDNYTSPCGTFAGNCMIYMYGAWLEPQGILGVVDDMDTLYIIKSDGEELSRTTSRQMKLSFEVVGLIALRDLTAERSLLSSFCIITTDGTSHFIETNKKRSSCVTSSFNLNNQLKLDGQSSLRVACLDFCPIESLVITVCSAVGRSGNLVNDSGLYYLNLWRLSTNLVFELLFSSHAFEGLFLPSSSPGPFVTAKVLFSPHGKYVAALDLNGFLDIYEICCQPFSLTLTFLNSNHLEGEGKRKCLKNVLDFSWWSDQFVVLSVINDALIIIDVKDGRILRKDEVIRNAILSRIGNREGHMFALENLSFAENSHMSLHGDTEDKVEPTVSQEDHLYPNSCVPWRLLSMSERSVPEIYALLIGRKQYKEALEFARNYCLDSDEVYKSCWLCSDQGVDEITTILKNVKDIDFVLSECVDKAGKTEDAAFALLLHGLSRTDCYKFSSFENDTSVWKYRVSRLQLLQCKDRLETFLGINMGRFSAKEYKKFCVSPISESAILLAESGKIGALNLLFKRHAYSLSSNTMHILGAIPETIPVQTYSQLLPGSCPPICFTSRDDDWVESEKMLSFTRGSSFDYTIDVRTENLLKLSQGLVWPSASELSNWYKSRALEIDNLSGQLDNCLSLVDIAFRHGVVELSHFLEDVAYLHQLTYSNDGETNYLVSISSWEQVPDYEKFKMMLKGVEGESLLQKLLEKAIPFMHVRDCPKNSGFGSRSDSWQSIDSQNSESFLVKWLKEIAAENKLDICLAVIKEGCEGMHVNGIFKDEVEAVETALSCIYSCTLLDCWNIMSSIISNLPHRVQKDKSLISDDLSSGHTLRSLGSPRSNNKYGNLDTSASMSSVKGTLLESTRGDELEKKFHRSEELDKRVKTAEGHIEVGRLLANYQVPKPLNFFLVAYLDERNVRQLIRLVLSKFGRQQGRADSDWASLWIDMQSFQAKAFSFLDKEYLLTEFCRGLLKAGKFSLARNYLKGSGNTVLASEKAEGLVIQAAREYFFSASSLSASEIWKAKECLYLFPDSDNVKAELDIIDALTKKLPSLGVTLLPMQFRQIGNPMEIISMVIANQTRAYLDVDELIEIARLLGLKSQDDIAAIQEAVAREAAVTGDLQLAFELCIELAKKDHGSIWDLASAIAKGPILENMDTASRKQLLGFALSYCDGESVGELLHAWKAINMQSHSEKIVTLAGSSHSDSFSHSRQPCMEVIHDPDNLETSVDGILYGSNSDKHDQDKKIEDILCCVIKDWPSKSRSEWDCILKESDNSSFVSVSLPLLFELCMEVENHKQATSTGLDEKYDSSVKVQAGLCILSWLTANNLIASDDLIASLAKHTIESPESTGEDVIGCSILLNLVDSFHGVKWIEEQLRGRKGYQESYTMMNLGMMYSSLQSLALECSSPSQRRSLLSHTFQERNWSFGADDLLKIDGVESKFWRDWLSKLEEQKMLAEQARELERIIPGVETARFLSGDHRFIEDIILSFVDSVKLEKKHILKEAMKIADTYGLKRTKVVVRYLRCTLVSLLWTDEEITLEVSDFKDDVVASAAEIISMIVSAVYPEIEGLNKQRLSYIYSILSTCSSYLRRTQDLNSMPLLEPVCEHKLELFRFYKILEQECRKISFIADLNFKNIANLHDLSFGDFNEEVYKHLSEATVASLADMVHVLIGIYDDPQGKGLASRIDVYRRYIMNILADLKAGYKARFKPITSSNFSDFITGVDNCYENCQVYVRALSEEEMICILQKLCKVCIPDPLVDINNESLGKNCLLELLSFWIKVAENFPVTIGGNDFEGISFVSSPSKYLVAFRDLVLDGNVSAMQGWTTLYRHCELSNCLGLDISLFCKAMVLSGCHFNVVVDIFSEGKSSDSLSPPGTEAIVHLYTNITDFCLNEVISGSGNQHTLHKLLSSVSKVVDDRSEDLNAVRHRIWEKLTVFSDNKQLPSHLRVYALELMQFILGRKLQSFSDDPFSGISAWEGWNILAVQYGSPENTDAPCRLTGNLVALKSNQLLAAISPELKVSPENLGTVDLATSCYLLLLDAAVSEKDFETLQAVLLEWEKLFVNQIDHQKSLEPIEDHHNWSGDEWGEGWGEEEDPIKQVKHEIPSVHPLHACWMETIKRLVKLSKSGVLTEVVDRSLEKSLLVLLSEKEAEEVLELLTGIDPILCLKIMLLLPYEDLWFRSLSALEEKLKQGVLKSHAGEESELLVLILSSGLLPSITNDPSYSKIFSYLCSLMGHLSRKSQEDIVKHNGSNGSPTTAVLFCRLLFPCFISELVISGHYLLAGHMVSRWMHTHASFSFLTVVEVGLRKYLEGLLHNHLGNDRREEKSVQYETLVHTCANLSRKMQNLLQTSLSALKSISSSQ